MDSISFPHLNITFSHVGKSIDVFGFSIAYYGIVIALGIIVALFFILREAKRLNLSEDAITDIFFAGVISGVIGARVYYVIFSWDMYKDNLISIFNIRQGGLAIYGGIIFGAVAVFVMSKKKGIDMLLSADAVIPGVLIGQIFGRWGNFFNREVFGGYSDGILAMRLPVDAVRSLDDVTKEMLDHAVSIDGITYIDVHPTFLYESLFNLLVFIFLILFRKHKKWNGEVFCLYLLLYGIGRFIIEGVRTDQLKLMNTDIPVSQALSGVLVVFAAGWFAFMMKKGK